MLAAYAETLDIPFMPFEAVQKPLALSVENRHTLLLDAEGDIPAVFGYVGTVKEFVVLCEGCFETVDESYRLGREDAYRIGAVEYRYTTTGKLLYGRDGVAKTETLFYNHRLYLNTHEPA